MEISKEKEATNAYTGRVHRILAHSYTMYFILFLVGVFFDSIFKFKIFTSSIAVLFGFVLLILASLLIIWAQKASRSLDIKNLSKETFCKGPYCYTRSPTNWGLFLLISGFGIIVNAVFVVFFSFLSFLIAKFFFLNKEEEVLTAKYGTPYLEYKKQVKL